MTGRGSPRRPPEEPTDDGGRAFPPRSARTPPKAGTAPLSPALPPELGDALRRVGRALGRSRRDVAVVVDSGPTMGIWRETVHEFVGVLQECGAFGRITVHRLPYPRSVDPATLPRHDAGTRLTLLLTDGAGPRWRSHAVEPLLRRWGQAGPVALIHLLPHPLWPATGLRGWQVLLRSRSSAAANHRLRWRARGLGPDVPGLPPGRQPDVPVPVLELTPRWLDAWAALLGGAPSAWLPLTVVFPRARVPDENGDGEAPADAATRVVRFRSAVSRDVFTLATMLAAVPLSRPVVADVHRALLPGGSLADLAQLLVHGLLRPAHPPRGPARDGTRVAFAFTAGVREELLAAARRADVVRAVELVGDRTGSDGEHLWRLPRLLRGAAVHELPPVDEESGPWLAAESAVLHALSGPFLRPAREVDAAVAVHREREQRAQHEGTTAPAPRSQAVARTPDDADRPTAQPTEPIQPKGRPAMTQQTPAHTVGSDRTRNTPTVWGNIPPRNPNFTGREELLDALHQRLLREKATAVLPHALHGMGGVGKSLLAVEYLYRRMTEYDVVWWISAERTAQISLSLVELAPRLNLQPGSDSSSTVAAVLEALRIGVPYTNWLLVFDNAESPEAVRQFFPAGGPGNILITSRNPQWASIARPLEVDVFLREESKQLLRVRGPEISDEDADRLAEALGDLPLAIEQAAAWHAETGMLVDEYLRLLNEKRVDLLRGTAPLDNQHPVIAAWNISLDQLESKNPAAYQLLQVCSFYAPEPIARTLFARMPRGSIAPELDAALEDPIRLGQVIREIGRYSLARFNHRNNSLQMHRLVQAALLFRMTEDDRADMQRGAHLLLAASDPNDPDNAVRWERYGSLYPHVVVSDAVQSDESWVRNLVVNEVIALLRWGDYESCLELARTAHETWSQKLGEDHGHTLLIAKWLGFLLFTMGSYPEAAELNSAVLDAYRGLMGPEAQDTIDALGNVAIDHRVRGAFGEALELSESVHQQYQRLLGPDDPETLRAAHNVGVSLRLVGDFGRARELDQLTWHSWTEIYGQDHVNSLRTWLGLILDTRELGDYATALTYHREIVEQAGTLLGNDNPLTLSCFRHLAVALRKAGEHVEAAATAEQARTELVRRYGDHNPESMAATLELTVHRRHSGDLQEALRLGTTICQQYEGTYGTHHPHALSAALNLAITYRLLGNAAASQYINSVVLEEFTATLGENHPSTLVCRTNLASDHFALGDSATALELDTQTLRRSQAVFDEDHPSTLACAANLAMDLRTLGRTEEADALHTDTRERLARKLGSSHPAVTQAADWEHRADCDIDPMPL
ncbi:FxSxx-COOH system tetratricopeptide repeat protein [Streptomyces sp. NBC_00183]|uniref:FxSxx-COOH system tetratricopeptide repeat protein n=1 Tax=unclassified Streptomyces TaxID=2593676 RepID=UPI002253EBDF|nr:FxSxx-COOH system tetratricopeptide repeat protein [Streptomyces sp. NBC_00183]MCX5287544.1 FxSxx-COOH system tetratricopeptide repeat protein [Streptomyces sp. NBC_00183]